MHKMPIVDPSGYRDFNPTTHQRSNRINHGGQESINEAQIKKDNRQREIDRTREEKYLNLGYLRNARSSTHKDFNATSHQTKEPRLKICILIFNLVIQSDSADLRNVEIKVKKLSKMLSRKETQEAQNFVTLMRQLIKLKEKLVSAKRQLTI